MLTYLFFTGGINAPIARDATGDKLKAFSLLPLGWHYGDGVPINRDTIDMALQIYWSSLLCGFTHTDAFPGSDGAIQLAIYHTDYKRDRHYIGVVIEATGEASIFYEIN